jgi:hypothetical protein
MISENLGLIELFLVIGPVLLLAIRELIVTRQQADKRQKYRPSPSDANSPSE